MLGAVIGDIVGSVYEHNNYRAKNFHPFFHPHAFYTDDTVCTVAVADILLHEKPAAETLRDWGRRYFHNGGWGARFGQWLAAPQLQPPYNSFGNGSAMRVSAAGYLATSLEQAVSYSNTVTEVTHNHPEGMKGAAATACAIHLARQGQSAEQIRTYVEDEFAYNLSDSVDEIRTTYLYNEICQRTVPEALTCALEATDFEDAIRNAISIGGDSDTIAAIAGAVAEARFGIPDDLAVKGWSYLPEDMTGVLRKLYATD